MPIKIGINGFGRMGRLALRAGWQRADIEFVHVNEPHADEATSAHLLEFDSIHGRWMHEPEHEPDELVVEGQRLAYTRHASPNEIAWHDRGVDIVLECSGKFKTRELLEGHLEGGARKVVVSAPLKSGALNIVMGVNHGLYDPSKHDVVTAASCTTNCLAPVVKVLLESVGIVHGSITTIHNVTNTQRIVDAPHSDLRRARSALTSLIPTSTGSAEAISLIYPELRGKLYGLAVRVPLLNASLTDCVFELPRSTTADELNAEFRAAAAEAPLRGILGIEAKPLVSVDFKGDTRSCVVDGPSTMVIDGTHAKILAWYDSEIGYVQRMVDLTVMMAASMSR